MWFVNDAMTHLRPWTGPSSCTPARHPHRVVVPGRGVYGTGAVAARVSCSSTAAGRKAGACAPSARPSCPAQAARAARALTGNRRPCRSSRVVRGDRRSCAFISSPSYRRQSFKIGTAAPRLRFGLQGAPMHQWTTGRHVVLVAEATGRIAFAARRRGSRYSRRAAPDRFGVGTGSPTARNHRSSCDRDYPPCLPPRVERLESHLRRP